MQTKIDPTTPLGFVSAQDIYDAATEMDMYEWADNGHDLRVKSYSEEHAAISLFEIHLPDGYEATTEDIDALGAMIFAIALRETPSHDEYMEKTIDNHPDA